MTALDDKITALEVKINGYETLDGISEEKWNRLSGLITSGRETLNRLLDERKAQSAGKFICGSI